MLQKIIKNIADNKNTKSLSHHYRSKRFDFFLSLINKLPRPIKIIDIGGTSEFWKAMNFQETDITITLLNLEEINGIEPPFKSLKGDATNLANIPNQSYDIVFSNSVIEHLFTWENQQKMADEVKRIGKYHFIQTPNYWFPIEPHWVFPFFQYLPKKLRYWLTEHFTLGHIVKLKDKVEAKKQVEEVRLLSKSEIKKLFPNSAIYSEKFMTFNKSFTAYSIEI